ncbi:GH32 C-terminal domain-containing protein [Corynebacterium sp.]|uniref:GH32 C-terminal domain-containing protein n=1 Tax=Corynebacterium sp. TaxID=1720 RepID=UPI002A908ABE|nr:GH32 C-terminal domain-containing protein [Corynebacterium sp.]MDY5784796.1 GH32 C-terminal domain-containing protein [Corynebacterium sp.]
MSVYRPELHFTADKGILEGAAGVLRDGATPGAEDTWHLFHQYKLSPDSPSRWGHAMSEGNPFDWVECDDAVVPTGGETQVRAGAVVAARGGVDLYFTSVTATGTSIQISHAEDRTELCTDIHEDFAVNPAFQRRGDVVTDAGNFTRFRSPCVVPGWVHNDDRDQGVAGWLMLAVAGPTEHPDVVVLTSEDGTAWSTIGALKFDGNPGFDPETDVLVAPRIIRLRDQVDDIIYDVLMFTLEREGGDETFYVTGTLTDNIFKVVTPALPIDRGHDFSRPRATTYTEGTSELDERYNRAYIYGPLRSSGRNADLTKELNWETGGWSGVLSLPRRVTLQNGRLYQTPAYGLPDAVDETRRAKMWTGLCEIPVGSSVVAELVDAKDEVCAVITHSGDQITLDRLDGSPAVAELGDDDEDSVTIIVDSSTIEVFAGGGAVTLSSRFWPADGCSGIRVRAHGDAEIFSEWRRGN